MRQAAQINESHSPRWTQPNQRNDKSAIENLEILPVMLNHEVVVRCACSIKKGGINVKKGGINKH